jgi:hypothetical protein
MMSSSFSTLALSLLSLDSYNSQSPFQGTQLQQLSGQCKGELLLRNSLEGSEFAGLLLSPRYGGLLWLELALNSRFGVSHVEAFLGRSGVVVSPSSRCGEVQHSAFPNAYGWYVTDPTEMMKVFQLVKQHASISKQDAKIFEDRIQQAIISASPTSREIGEQGSENQRSYDLSCGVGALKKMTSCDHPPRDVVYIFTSCIEESVLRGFNFHVSEDGEVTSSAYCRLLGGVYVLGQFFKDKKVRVIQRLSRNCLDESRLFPNCIAWQCTGVADVKRMLDGIWGMGYTISEEDQASLDDYLEALLKARPKSS